MGLLDSGRPDCPLRYWIMYMRRVLLSTSLIGLAFMAACSSSNETNVLGVGGTSDTGGRSGTQTATPGGTSSTATSTALTSGLGGGSSTGGRTSSSVAGASSTGGTQQGSAVGGSSTGVTPSSGGASSNQNSSAAGGATGGAGGAGGAAIGGAPTGGSAVTATSSTTGGSAPLGGATATGGTLATGGATSGTTGGSGSTNVNECQLGTHTCDANASCTDLPNGYQCTCLTGFVGDGHKCRTCAIKNGGCDTLTSCSVVGNTIVCGACPSGYSDPNGDGTQCTDIDECANKTSGCDPNAICTNTPGSVSCACPTGWLGNGKSCVPGVKAITVTSATNCALKHDGNIWCWGAVSFQASPTPNPVPLKITTLGGWDSFYWDQTRCGIRSGELYCWGDNLRGSVGVGSTSPVDAPTRIGTEHDWTAVSGNSSTTCGIRGGLLFCWGFTMGLRATDPQALSYPAPQQWSNLSGWQSVAVGNSVTCGIREGELYCWGGAAALGDGSSGPSPTPLRIGTDTDWTNAEYGAAIRSGQLYTWGDNTYGKIGNGTTSSSVYQLTPLRIGLAIDWTSISTRADNYNCGVRSGIGYCWGNNNGGELGIGNLTSPTSPTQVDLSVTWTQIKGGGTSSCGIADNKAYCWGANNFGQVGDGTTTTRLSPVAVVFP